MSPLSSAEAKPPMLNGLFILLAFQLAGEAIVHALRLSIPGPVIGLVGLAATLGFLQRSPRFGFESVSATSVGRVAGSLLGVLGVLFVPAGVGIMQEYRLLLDRGLALLAVLVLSTLISLLTTVGVFLAVARLKGRRAE